MSLAAAVLVSLVGVAGGIFGTVLKLRPERENLTVDASQKAVALLRETLDELADELERALAKVALLQEQLENAIERTHELERLLETERAKVAQLERRLAELDARHP